jgi:hypothetical protein
MAANKEHLKALLEEATSIAERATRDGRSMTAAERTAVEAKLDQVQAGKSELQLVQAVDELNGRYGLGVATTGLGTAGSIGSAILSSPAFADRRRKGFSGQWSTGPIEVPFGAKADLTEAASPVIPPEFLRGVVETAFRKLTVQDLLASGTTDSNQVNVATETVATNAAAAIAEGAAKPESTLTLAMVAEPEMRNIFAGQRRDARRSQPGAFVHRRTVALVRRPCDGSPAPQRHGYGPAVAWLVEQDWRPNCDDHRWSHGSENHPSHLRRRQPDPHQRQPRT